MNGEAPSASGEEVFRVSGTGVTLSTEARVKLDTAHPLALLLDPAQLGAPVKSITWGPSRSGRERGTPGRRSRPRSTRGRTRASGRWFVPLSTLFPAPEDVSPSDLQLVELELVFEDDSKRDVELSFHAQGPNPTLLWTPIAVGELALASAEDPSQKGAFTFRSDRVSNPSGRAVNLWIRTVSDGAIRLEQEFRVSAPTVPKDDVDQLYLLTSLQRSHPALQLMGISVEEGRMLATAGDWQAVRLAPGQTVTIDSQLARVSAQNDILSAGTQSFTYITCHGSIVTTQYGTRVCDGDGFDQHPQTLSGSVAKTGSRIVGGYTFQTAITDARDPLAPPSEGIESRDLQLRLTSGAELSAQGWSWLPEPDKLYFVP
jgi:hypothetical protein